MPKPSKKKADLSTEEKIKAAARKVFMQKGYHAARTRDIAEAAGINLALLNYYFRSKEKLFHQIMMERVQQLFGTVAPILNDESLPLEEKIRQLAVSYIDLLNEHPDLPMFVLNEMRTKPDFFKTQFHLDRVLLNSSILRQLKARRNDLNPAHSLINIMALLLFPFLAKPVLFATGLVNEKNFRVVMKERRELVPGWIKAILQTQTSVR